MQNSRKNNYIVVAFGLIALVCISIHAWQTNYPFSKRQPLSNAESMYDSCKEEAPPGFDCVMIPVLVSEDSITELGAPY